MRKKDVSIRKKIRKTLLQFLSIIIGGFLVVKGGKMLIIHIMGLIGFTLLCIGLFMIIVMPLLISNHGYKEKAKSS